MYYVICKHPLTPSIFKVYIYIYIQNNIYSLYIYQNLYIQQANLKQSNYLNERLPRITKQIFIRNQTRLTISLKLPPKQQLTQWTLEDIKQIRELCFSNPYTLELPTAIFSLSLHHHHYGRLHQECVTTIPKNQV